ncbi:A/G-specific adenine glycosylase [Legionella yabuuchiae]|uniref:A/G-specific adenine glycosylase n=1 Tax=Legionella yabuuchiae TaxID=376727 RepID=UPI001055070F|nr:A/G-specific adenine glycosylase [Legionella yabuuchiae]
MNTSEITKQFTLPLLQWYQRHGRKELPWKSADPYPVWISEIMLQQTQVKTVIPFFNRFMSRFPNLETLANAAIDDVLAFWSGLGYYNRARNIHKAAQILYFEHQGLFSDDPNELTKLPGIGQSTAAAITSLVFNQPTPILDGNVKRVLCRFFLIPGSPDETLVNKQLWELAAQCMSQRHCAEYTQAIMDLGATCCTIKAPQCTQCPLQSSCRAFSVNEVLSYPHKKTKKAKPLKSQQFLLLFNKHERIYLEKNFSEGLWGGLWCMPAIDSELPPERYLAEKYNLEVMQRIPLKAFKHTFSHFNLRIQPIVFLITPGNGESILEAQGRWWDLNEAKALGIAKPTRQIIETFQELLIKKSLPYA